MCPSPSCATESIQVFLFMFLCCRVESVIVRETRGRTRGECAGEGRGNVVDVCAVNISR